MKAKDQAKKHKALFAAQKELNEELADNIREILDPKWTPAERGELAADLVSRMNPAQLAEIFGSADEYNPKPSRKSSLDLLSEAIQLKQRALHYENAGRPLDAKRLRAKAEKKEAEGKKKRPAEPSGNSN